MKHLALGLGLVAMATMVGLKFKQPPFKAYGEFLPADQQVLAHRDSPYTNITWVVSEAANSAELRFFDRVEGGVCLRPSWADLAEFDQDGRLSHLRMPDGYPLQKVHPDSTWPTGMPPPNPGPVAHSKYVNLYPVGVLCNERLMTAAGGNPRAAAPRVLVVGLGSGVGMAVLAHHFPQASITVVDIDTQVVAMVRDHFPLIRWLESADQPDNRRPRTADGRRRLDLQVADARQFIRYAPRQTGFQPWDLVILDAYTSGSTIPPHLMTQEFYEEIAGILAPDGLLLSNIIGSYDGKQHRVVGGAIRSMRAANPQNKGYRFPCIHNFPIVHEADPRSMDDRATRNNMVLAAATPLDPERCAKAWTRLKDFVPYPEFPSGRFLSRQMLLRQRSGTDGTALVGLGTFKDGIFQPIDQSLWQVLAPLSSAMGNDEAYRYEDSSATIALARSAVLRQSQGGPLPTGWDQERLDLLGLHQVDWIDFPRRTWKQAIDKAGEKATSTTWAHDGGNLVGPLENERQGRPECLIVDAPLFTDSSPNADIMNH